MAPPSVGRTPPGLELLSPSGRGGAAAVAATHPRRVASTARDVASEVQRLNGPARRASLPASSAAPAPPDSPPQRPEVERPTPRQVRGAGAEAGSPAGSARATRGRNPWRFFAFYRPAGSRGCRVEARGRQGHGRAEVQRGLCPTPRGPPPGAPASIAGSWLGHSLADPNSCLQRNLEAGSEWH